MRAPTLKAVSFDTLKTIKLIKEKREAIIIKIAIIEGRYIFGWRSKKCISEKFSVLTSLSWDIDLFHWSSFKELDRFYEYRFMNNF